MKKAIIIFGYPGSGKSTQAQLLAEKLHYYHLNSGRILENIIYDPKHSRNKEVAAARKAFESGGLMSADFTLEHLLKKVKATARQGDGIIFSGSPRTQGEAFGTKKHREGHVEAVSRLYGRKNVLVFLLKVSEKEALKRNTKRLICSVCGTPILGAALSLNMRRCPFCGGILYKRKLDDPKIIRERFEEFEEKTMPIIEGIQKMGYAVHVINGTKMPYQVLEQILRKIPK
jgi:adenylate kinase